MFPPDGQAPPTGGLATGLSPSPGYRAVCIKSQIGYDHFYIKIKFLIFRKFEIFKSPGTRLNKKSEKNSENLVLVIVKKLGGALTEIQNFVPF